MTGGAVRMQGDGALSLTDVQVLDSDVTGVSSNGGGLYAARGTGELRLERVTITGNRVQMTGGAGGGGGLFVINRPVTLRNVTIADNHVAGSAGAGGGISFVSHEVWADLRLVNVTVAGNSAANEGGGLSAFMEPLFGGSAELVDSILAGNAAPSGPDCRAMVSQLTLVGEVLIENPSSCATGSGTPIVGQDPLLGELALNAPGQTETMALAAESPAIDAGGECTDPATDQRGVARPQGAGCDLGAFEWVGAREVTNTDDSGPGSLRQAIADVDPGGTVSFADELGPEIELTSGVIFIDKALQIEGPGPQELDVSGGDSSRIFFVNTDGDVALSGLTVSDGLAEGGMSIEAAGGAILKAGGGRLSLTDVQVLDSEASADRARGGGIFAGNGNGELLLERVTIAGNQARSDGEGAKGGGLEVVDRPVTLRNVTIADNHVVGDGSGGGAWLEPMNHAAVLVNVTVAGNHATDAGGGLALRPDHDVSNIELVDSVVAGNSAGSGPDCATLDGGLLTLGGAVLIEDPSDCGTEGSGTWIGGQDPLLGELALNAPGQTQTMALRAGSPALDAGGECTDPATDQRGIARPQGSGCDLGAFEARPAVAELDPSDHAFGSLGTDDGASAPAELTLSNPADADLDLIVDTAELTGADAGQFTLDAGDCDDGAPGPPLARLVPGASCTVAVRFDPTSAGAKQATLIFETSGGNPAATLEGTATAPPEQPGPPDEPRPPDQTDPPNPPEPTDPTARTPALERLAVASRCLRPSRSGRVRIRLALRMARPGPVRIRIDRAIGTRAQRTCPARGKQRRFSGRFRTVKTYGRLRTASAAAVTRQVALDLRLQPGLYRITARVHTSDGKLSKPRRRFVRVLG